MILMQTQWNLAIPNRPPPKLVRITSFSEEHVTNLKSVSIKRLLTHRDPLDLCKVEIPILNIGHS